MLKVAIVGCGKIADAHASQIQRIKGCEIVGVCDSEPLMARQLYERFPVKRYFTDLTELLSDARPDVVHITTPPESHFDPARLCLEAGCHVYVEKPFTLDTREAEELVGLAEQRGLGLTVGHDAQFSHAAKRMRELIHGGYLGDAVVHMESYYGYDLGDAASARDFLSHGIARVAEFLAGNNLHVAACGFVSPFLRGIGDGGMVDELRVIVVDERHTTAYLTFSSRMRPLLDEFRVFGSRNGLILDELQQTVIKLRGRAFKSYVERFVPPLVFAKQYLGNAGRNMRLFLANEFHIEAGKKELIASFYRSIREGAPAPIPSREILLIARLTDAILEQVAKAPSPPYAAGAIRG